MAPHHLPSTEDEPESEATSAHDGGELNASNDSLAAVFAAARPKRAEPLPTPLVGTQLVEGRIAVMRRLGSGAMGTVYEVRDGDTTLALKTLNRFTPSQIYRLKKEFRRLCAVAHPNVVAVHELFNAGDIWFFTMEVVRGEPLDSYWRAQELHRSARAVPQDGFDLSFCYEVLKQIVEGVSAIHEAGLLHRDLKPSNVLAEPSGRIVIVDFGLVSDQLPLGGYDTVEHTITGTPGYMSPEQARGERATCASDWYAVGVILYELLTGRLPHAGSVDEVLSAKRKGATFQAPSTLTRVVPSELDELCVALLQPDPELRPTAHELRERCDRFLKPARQSVVINAPRPRTVPLVGREAALRRLEAAYASARSGSAVLALLRGNSGMGKTTLLNTLVTRLRGDPDVVVLGGTCLQRESVPYKAFDEVVDQLTALLLRLSDEQAAQLLPRHVHTLTKLFPALLRVPVYQRALEQSDPAAVYDARRQGFAAIREVFCRIADRRPLVITIDDLHWADMDSVRLLAALLTPPDAPKLLLVGCHRAEQEDSAIIGELLAFEHLRPEIIDLGPLGAEDSAALALSVMPDAAEADVELARRIAAESQGVPLYVHELARAMSSRSADTAAPSLEALIHRRVRALPVAARELLELIAVAGRPLSRQLLALSCDASGLSATLSVLLAAQLVLSAPSEDGDKLKVFHERVRLAVLALVSPERQVEHHRTLATILEQSASVAPEWVMFHLRASGQGERARHFTLRAAQQAMDSLAYGRAADLYALALPQMPPGPEAAEFELCRGDALSRVGRAAEAAQAYLAAARQLPSARARKVEGLAASQWLRAGHVAEAVLLLRDLVSQCGVRWPNSTSETIARFLVARLRVRATGHAFVLRKEEDIPRAQLDTIDVLYPAQTVLGTYDYLRGAYFAAVAYPLSLAAGEPKRVVTALAAEAVYGVMLDGSGAGERSKRLQQAIDRVADESGDAYGVAVASLTVAMCAYWSGDWKRVVEAARTAETTFQREVSGGAWEANLVRSVRHTVMIQSGRFRELEQELPEVLLEASERSDLYAQLDAMRGAAAVSLRDDRLQDAAQQLQRMQSLLDRFPLSSLTHLVMSAQVTLQLYGEGARHARALLALQWRRCKRLGLHMLPLIRVNYAGMYGDCVRADAALSGLEKERELERTARRLDGVGVAWAGALSCRLRADAQRAAGAFEPAARLFQQAGELFESQGLGLAAHMARYEGGRLPGASAQARRCASEAEAHFAAQGIRRHERWAGIVHSIY